MDPKSHIAPFSEYFECWVKQLEEHLQSLVMARRHLHQYYHNHHRQQDEYYQAVVSKMIAHYKAYYTAKWATAAQTNRNVISFFSPSWLSPMGLAHLWLTGWKPTAMAFRLVDSLSRTRAPLTSLAQLTDDQWKRVEELRARVRAEEEEVEKEMERRQVAVADWRMVEYVAAAKRSEGNKEDVAKLQGDDAAVLERTVTRLLNGLERVMKSADVVRLKTLKGLSEVLTPRQFVDFLAVFSMVLIQQNKKTHPHAPGTNS